MAQTDGSGARGRVALAGAILALCVVIGGLAAFSNRALAEAGASGDSPLLAQALIDREWGDVDGALAAIETALAEADNPADIWEAQLAQAEATLAAGDAAAAGDLAGRLLAEGEGLFGIDAPRLSAPLVVLGEATDDADAALGHLLRAARLARAGAVDALGPDGMTVVDRQAHANHLAALAALAEHLLARGDTSAAALLGAEVAVTGETALEGLPPRWQDGVLAATLAHLRAGRPVEALARAHPMYVAETELGTLRAVRLYDAFDAELYAAAAREAEATGTDAETVIDGWFAAGAARHDAIVADDNRMMQEAQPMMAALGARDAVAADAAARQAFGQVRADDPLVIQSYLTLLPATMRAGRDDLATTWGLRLVEFPPAYLASLHFDPIPLLTDIAYALGNAGDQPVAITLAETVAVVAPLRAGSDDGLASMKALNLLAQLYQNAGRGADAVRTYDQTLTLAEAGLAGAVGSPDDWAAQAITALVGRATLRQDAGDLGLAEADLLAARTLLQSSAEAQKPKAWIFVNFGLRDVLVAQGRSHEAVQVLQEGAAQVESLAGPEAAATAEAWYDLAALLASVGQKQDAVDAVARARRAALVSLSPEDRLRLRIEVLAQTLADPGDAAASFASNIADSGPTAIQALADGALLATAAGDLDRAIAFLDAGRVALGPDAPMRPYLDASRGEMLRLVGKDEAALESFRAATWALTQPDRRDEPNARTHLPSHVALALELSVASDGIESVNYFTEAFQVAQRVGDLSAGSALGQATARMLGEGPEADRLARDLGAAGRTLEAAREVYLAALSEGGDTSGTRTQMIAARERLAAVQAEVAAAFPAYAALADPRPVDLLSTMRLLGPDEVLLLYASADPTGAAEGEPVDSFVFALTNDGFVVGLLPPQSDLADLAQELRCAAALTDPRCGTTRAGTRGVFSLDADEDGAGQDPEFDFALAREAWDALFAPVADALEGKTSVIVVPDRTLSAMPFHLALAEPPGPDTTLRNAPWLLRRMAVTVVPTVSSFAALRNAGARPSAADRPFLGVGDPLIGAQAAGPLPYACDTLPGDPLYASALSPSSGPILRDAGTADPGALVALSALPDTRCELQSNAQAFGPGSTVLLHDQATEASVKGLSEAGDLARYRVLSFATHGLIAGEVGAQNAGLVLTPPAAPDATDDGLLTVSEIAGLRLDADFVLLSACNTASGSSESTEGLAGLASAFFLAGARGLLVSHWPVYSDAATELTTGLVAALAGPDQPSRSEALRRSVLAILDDPAASPRELHPSYWAPFMVVGDGRAGQG